MEPSTSKKSEAVKEWQAKQEAQGVLPASAAVPDDPDAMWNRITEHIDGFEKKFDEAAYFGVYRCGESCAP